MKNLTLVGLMALVLVLALVSCAPAVTPVADAPAPTATPVANTPVPAAAPVADTPAPAASAGTWQVVIQDMNVKHATTVAGFLNDKFGLTAGYAGETHYTTDGGQTWPQAKNQSMCRYGLDIVDQKLAWTAGNGGNVRVSTDGGQNWQAVSNLKDSGISQFISFIDAKIGWVANQTTLWTTQDGGQNWTEIKLPEGAKKLVEIALRAANDGYLLDEAGVLYITQDGGQKWTSQPLELKDGVMSLPHIAAVRFFDAEHGLIVASLAGGGKNKVVALRTADGGKTWTEEEVPAQIGSSFYLTHDGSTLTVVDMSNQISVLRYTGSPLALAQ
jgi:photosystem II stability/assembly factor-like uncharacterized protein